MPFTFAHAAAGLPFRRMRLAWTAFFIGSFAPDFEYFLRLAPQNAYGHRWPGVLTLTLPVALAALLAYELFVRELLISLFPESWQRRLPPPPRHVSGAWLGLVLISVLLGIATHIFWDGFTHDWTWATDLWPALRVQREMGTLGTHSIAHLLQWISSVVGMAVVLAWARNWYQRAPAIYPVRAQGSFGRSATCAVIFSIALLASIWRALIYTGIPADDFQFRHFFVLFLIDLIAMIWWTLLTAGVLRKFSLSLRQREKVGELR